MFYFGKANYNESSCIFNFSVYNCLIYKQHSESPSYQIKVKTVLVVSHHHYRLYLRLCPLLYDPLQG